MRRLIPAVLLALAVAPGTWWRSPPPEPDRRQRLEITTFAVPHVELGPLEPTGAWELDSPNSDFGSYSGLVVLGDDTLLAVGDAGGTLRFSVPGVEPAYARIGQLVPGDVPKWERDAEALTRDPASGRIWAAFEMTNRIERYDAALAAEGVTKPEAMQGWPGNTGPEAMVRLADGRFVVLAESRRRWMGGDTPGLLFAGDPLDEAEPIAFRFVPPTGYSPVDMAQLPDGKVVILLRKVEWGIPPRFSGKLMLADPAAIRDGEPWPAEPLADLAAPLPRDNYEGLAALPDGHGGAVLWLISDDNGMRYQRTLLLRLAWPAREKARESPRAPD